MIPYLPPLMWRLGPLTIHAFGIAVAVAMSVSFAVAERRYREQGLSPAIGSHLGWWLLGGGMIGAHLFSVLFYFPEKMLRDPWLLLRVWEDISSFGGILGGLTGALVYFAFRAPDEVRAQRIAYLDAVAFAFPVSLAIGRFGCALAHDHPGSITSSPLAISLSSTAARAFIMDVYQGAGLTASLPSDAALSQMGFHDLGWYEFLYLSLVVLPLFAFWHRRPRAEGFYLVMFPALYLPVRFGLDLLRVGDVRYIGLTPAQWVALLVMAALPFAARRLVMPTPAAG